MMPKVNWPRPRLGREKKRKGERKGGRGMELQLVHFSCGQTELPTASLGCRSRDAVNCMSSRVLAQSDSSGQENSYAFACC